MSSTEETQEEELGGLSETQPISRERRVFFFSLLLILTGVLVIIYLGLRTLESQRALVQLQQTNRALQEDVEELKQSLETTAGQLDLAINAVTLARIHRDDGQKALRDMENRLAESREAREGLETQVALNQAQIETLSKALVQVESALADSQPLPEYLYTGSYTQTTEFITSTYPTQSVVLTSIVDVLGGVEWVYGGNNPEQGLDSRGMAALVLSSCGLASGATTEVRDQLPDILDMAEEPQVGDLIRYPDDAFMFFFLDQDGEAFVTGMTPYGVQIFVYGFKPVEGIYRVPYGEETQCEFTKNP